jgi:hypothetical protein
MSVWLRIGSLHFIVWLSLAGFSKHAVSAEQWTLVNDGKPATLYLDHSRVAKNGSRVKVWVRSLFSGNTIDARHLLEFDCELGKYREAESITRIGSEIISTRNDDDESFQGIGETSGFVPAYLYACRLAGLVAAKPVEPEPAPLPVASTEESAWILIETDSNQTESRLDVGSMRVSSTRILAWIKVSEPADAEPFLTLHEYDCEKNVHRIHAMQRYRMPQPGGWQHPTSMVINAFSLPCRATLTEQNADRDQKPATTPRANRQKM